MFIASLVHDLIKGMIYLQKTDLQYHGNLKSSNCVVTSRWVLQITDYGLHELRQSAEKDIGDHEHYRSKSSRDRYQIIILINNYFLLINENEIKNEIKFKWN